MSHSKPDIASTWKPAIIAAISGVGFGFALSKGLVFAPQIIGDQFTLTRHVMLKMFLSAVSSSAIAHSLLAIIPSTTQELDAARKKNTESDRTLLASAVGASLLGAGMAISGSCPGTLIVQIGAGRGWDAIYALAGAFSGAFGFSFLEPTLRSWYKKSKPEDGAIDRSLGVPYWSIALPLAAAMAAVVYAAELYSPTTMELGSTIWPLASSAGSNLIESAIKAPVWHPVAAGAMLGLIQIPLVTLLRKSLGASSSYVTAAANFCGLFCPTSFAENVYLKGRKSGMNNWWQVIFMIGALAGSFVAASASNTVGSAFTSPWPPIASFLGGFMILFGSRLNDGCTSGHGISGFSQLAKNAWVAVPAMFGSGILTGTLLKYFGM